MLDKGDTAPDFELPDQAGEPIKLATLLDSGPVVLYFYPADFTPGCTTEACDFRDAMPGLDAKVLGVSPDSVEKHADFVKEHGLPFPLLADEDRSIAEAYGAYGTKKLYGKEVEGIIRSTFLIAPDGTIAEAMRNVRAKGHVERVRTRLEQLKA